ncbi:cytochrome P450 [Mycobacterium marseillense]|nr:cytochrome P450 [Mycobacterium marseillense]MDM3973562.1 cytochrome P450 [Mycobacterium marseillense]
MPDAKIDFNPFAVETIENPYPGLAILRKFAPVYEVENLFFRIISRYDDVVAALRDTASFSSSIIDASFAGDYTPVPGSSGNNMMAKDPPEHSRFRGLVNRAFTPKAVANLRVAIETFVADAIERIRDEPEWDFVHEIGQALPVNIFFKMLGVEPEMYGQARQWSHDIKTASRFTVGRQMPTADEDSYLRQAMKDYGDYLEYLVNLRREHPGDDLVSGLVQAADEGEQLSHQEVLTMVFLLIGAGTESTQKFISNTLLAFLNHPDQYRMLREDRSLIPNAVQEVLRFDGPAIFMARITTRDVEMAGTVIPAQSPCLVSFASANHDDSKFPNPERFDITRDTSGLVAFGHGLHRCLGAPLATLEGTVVLEQLLDNFAGFDWDPSRVVRDDNFFIRGLNRLPISPTRV